MPGRVHLIQVLDFLFIRVFGVLPWRLRILSWLSSSKLSNWSHIKTCTRIICMLAVMTEKNLSSFEKSFKKRYLKVTFHLCQTGGLDVLPPVSFEKVVE